MAVISDHTYCVNNNDSTIDFTKNFGSRFLNNLVQSKAQQADNISSYETGLLSLQDPSLWSFDENYSNTPMSLENSFSEEVAMMANLLPEPEQILPDLEKPGKVLVRPNTNPVTKAILLGGKKKLLTKDKIVPKVEPSENNNVGSFIPTVIPIMDDIEFKFNGDQLLQQLFEPIADEENNENQVFELSVPVVSQPNQLINSVWSEDSLFKIPQKSPSIVEDNEMRTVNPMEVEGLQEIQNQPDNDVSNENSLVEDDDTNEGLDLLKFVLDETIGPDDDDFKEFVKVDHSNDEPMETINFQDFEPQPSTSTAGTVFVKQELLEEPEQPLKRKRGRPRLPRTEPLLPRYSFFNDTQFKSNSNVITTNNFSQNRRPRGRPPTAALYANVEEHENTSEMSETDVKENKYRRMRDLNNAASKRCRLNRKRKFDDLEMQVDQEESRNTILKTRVQVLEEQVEKFKKAIIAMHKKKPSASEIQTQYPPKFDIDALVESTLQTHFS